MSEVLHPILTLLDEGLSLYRRNFLAFLLIAAVWCIPVAIAGASIVVALSWMENEGLAIVLGVCTALLLIPLTLYLFGGLSRAAAAAIDGQPVRFRQALAINPLRIISMGFYSLIYGILAQIAASMLSMVCICPAYLMFIALGAAAAATNLSETAGIVFGVVVVIFFLVIYALSLVLGGGVYSSLLYALQPWVQEAQPFGQALQRSLELVGYRFWRNLLVWCVTALVIAAVGVSVSVTVGVLVPLPLSFALGSESGAVRAITISAWLLGFVVVLPPLPIWMALLYRRNRAAREGDELQRRVLEWSRHDEQLMAEPPLLPDGERLPGVA